MGLIKINELLLVVNMKIDSDCFVVEKESLQYFLELLCDCVCESFLLCKKHKKWRAGQ